MDAALSHQPGWKMKSHSNISSVYKLYIDCWLMKLNFLQNKSKSIAAEWTSSPARKHHKQPIIRRSKVSGQQSTVDGAWKWNKAHVSAKMYSRHSAVEEEWRSFTLGKYVSKVKVSKVKVLIMDLSMRLIHIQCYCIITECLMMMMIDDVG